MNCVLNRDPDSITRVSPKDGSHYFFGYYDIPCLTQDDRFHLAHCVSFMDRLQTNGDICKLGMIDLHSGKFLQFGETNAWNFQQGCLLQWRGNHFGEAVYNVFEDGGYHSVIQNVFSGERRVNDYPIANVSPNGKYAASINMSRIYDFRPGYGYCNIKDPGADDNAPMDDGLRLLDLETGKNKLLFSYKDLSEVLRDEEGLRGSKLVINHVNFNTASNRIVFLLRSFPKVGSKWGTVLLSSDLYGNIFKWSHCTVVSHYHWRDEKVLAVYADLGSGLTVYETEDMTGRQKALKKEHFPGNIHCSYSPDRRFLLGDGYPDENGYRAIILYCFETDRAKTICHVYSPFPSNEDIRCDNHCRWMHDGKRITFDGVHEGFRGIYSMDIGRDMDELQG